MQKFQLLDLEEEKGKKDLSLDKQDVDSIQHRIS